MPAHPNPTRTSPACSTELIPRGPATPQARHRFSGRDSGAATALPVGEQPCLPPSRQTSALPFPSPHPLNAPAAPCTTPPTACSPWAGHNATVRCGASIAPARASRPGLSASAGRQPDDRRRACAGSLAPDRGRSRAHRGAGNRRHRCRVGGLVIAARPQFEPDLPPGCGPLTLIACMTSAAISTALITGLLMAAGVL